MTFEKTIDLCPDCMVPIFVALEGRKREKNVAVDPEPVEGGRLLVEEQDWQTVAFMLGARAPDALFATTERYTPHALTCAARGA